MLLWPYRVSDCATNIRASVGTGTIKGGSARGDVHLSAARFAQTRWSYELKPRPRTKKWRPIRGRHFDPRGPVGLCIDIEVMQTFCGRLLTHVVRFLCGRGIFLAQNGSVWKIKVEIPMNFRLSSLIALLCAAAMIMVLAIVGCGNDTSSPTTPTHTATPTPSPTRAINAALWVANRFNVVEFVPSQLVVQGVSTPVPQITIQAHALGSPHGVAFDAAGDLWVVMVSRQYPRRNNPTFTRGIHPGGALRATDSGPERDYRLQRLHHSRTWSVRYPGRSLGQR
jgi:hypothetical protein